jgi:hypothetical protein
MAATVAMVEEELSAFSVVVVSGVGGGVVSAGVLEVGVEVGTSVISGDASSESAAVGVAVGVSVPLAPDVGASVEFKPVPSAVEFPEPAGVGASVPVETSVGVSVLTSPLPAEVGIKVEVAELGDSVCCPRIELANARKTNAENRTIFDFFEMNFCRLMKSKL